MPLTPQLVTAEDYDRILTLFAATNGEHAIEHSPASTELELDEIATPDPEDDPAPSAPAGDSAPAEPGAVQDESEVIDDVDENLPTEEPADGVIPDRLVDQIAAVPVFHGTEDDRPLAPVVDLHTPRLQLLGPVTVLHPQGLPSLTPDQWKSYRLRAIELIAFISTHPGVDTDRLHECIFLGGDPVKGLGNRNRLTTAARRWLGQDAEGRHYLVNATGGIYNLTDSFSSDWKDWQELVGEDPTKVSTENLTRALQMVKGRPFSGVKQKYYGWADTLTKDMIASIGDVAHEVTTRALRDGDIRRARMAAAIGREVEPASQVLWRDALRAEHMAGDADAVERLVKQLEIHLTQISPEDPEPEAETEQLIAQLRHRRAS